MRLNSNWKKRRRRSTQKEKFISTPLLTFSAAVNPKALIPSVVRAYTATRAYAAVRAHSAASPQLLRSLVLVSSRRIVMLYLGWRSSLSFFFSSFIETRRIFFASRPLAIGCPSGSAKIRYGQPLTDWMPAGGVLRVYAVTQAAGGG